MNTTLALLFGWTTLLMISSSDKVAKKSIAGSRQSVLLTLAREDLGLTAADALRLYTYGCWCGVGRNAGNPVDDTDL
ncbi:unnamed protein product [Porites lobata]|uniref:Phospholipase A2 n=1 Tax=Porites lobata TaxID=104759 RepID=A0ABN8QJJ5_9CNID|nr:unnamed protein product [Porites lobata]